MSGALQSCSLTTEDVVPAGREEIPLQFGFTAQLLQAPIAAVVGMAAPGRVTGNLEGPVSQAGLDQGLPGGGGGAGSKGLRGAVSLHLPGVPAPPRPGSSRRGPPAHQSVWSTGQWAPPMPQ